MTYAVIRIRGTVNVKPDVKETLRLLMLTRANHCVLVRESPQAKGMLQKAKDYITWGEVTADTAVLLLATRVEMPGGARVTDKTVSASKKFPDAKAYAKALAEGTASLRDIGAKRVIRLAPPVGGHGKVKRPFKDKGALGYRGKKINDLISKMAGGV
ncbi:MAG: 50S ribosomal protein L30 [Euryarchaeota archaeon]|nr:50S ribosomal protein L30 [Euryarchaeota archaeon]